MDEIKIKLLPELSVIQSITVIVIDILEVLQHQIVVRRENATKRSRRRVIPQLLEVADFPERSRLTGRKPLIAQKSELIINLSQHRLELVAVLPQTALNRVITNGVIQRTSIMRSQESVGIRKWLDEDLLILVVTEKSISNGSHRGLRSLAVSVTEREAIAIVDRRQERWESLLIALDETLRFVPPGDSQKLFSRNGDVRVEGPRANQIEVLLAHRLTSAGITGSNDVVDLL